MFRTLERHFIDHPLEGLGWLCALQVLLWTALPAAGSLSPTLDVAEMLAWGQEWQLGYYKHPPLPAWIAQAARLATGEAIWGPMLASQLCVALTFVFVFLLGRRLMGPRDALLGTALLTSVFYFSWPTPELNHNVVQMPIWAAAIYLVVVISSAPRRLAPWLWLGVVAGLGVYAKYSVGVLYAVLGMWLLAEPNLRRALLGPAPWIGLCLALVIAAPHLVWLAESGFLPLTYAQNRSMASHTSAWRPLGFLVTQIADHLPMLVPLGLAFPFMRGAQEEPAPLAPHGLRYLAVATLGPVLLTAALALVTGAGLKDMWGAPMFTTSGLLAVALLRTRLGKPAAQRMLAGCLLLLVVLPAAFALQGPVADWLQRKPPRNGWPMAEIAGRLTDVWRRETGGPLRIVEGEPWLAGLVSAGSADRPSVRIPGLDALSPWILAQELARDGWLLVWFGGGDAPEGLDVSTQGHILVPWSRPGDLVIGYAIARPVSDSDAE
ncbi:glycosyltransferase family 39 protein [Breoghania sp. L-A4]|uniref:glycosyltransferase family 39 protein n=1 Tax=Breoghania sp. L-A4 TaxID=2304600 RepID=UPI000E35960A|nr:glycosyltransferase family 39 protein [Breoghania sp. L-A4]AXS38804.1 4-amino-4-deoxy-L-arabinose transferase [Breoghania sp. L-A4]